MADHKDLTFQPDAAPERKSPIRRLAETLINREGAHVIENDQLDIAEALIEDRRLLRKEMDLIAWTALDYSGGNEQDLKAVARRKLVQQSRVAWQQDPQLGAAVDLYNDFALGRGVPRPKARDEKVQAILDEAWDDEDNQLVLTSYAAQMALGTDLSLQANLFVLIFSGDDGRIKLGLLDHDTVENVVRDPENRRRILYYVAKRKTIVWDFQNDTPKAVMPDGKQDRDRIRYYAHWLNEPPDDKSRAPAEKMGEGRVYHVAINKTSEMAFGHPTMHRVLRWANAFNALMEARVDMARAAAAFVMKRKVKGTKQQIARMAEQALSRRSDLARQWDTETAQGPKLGPDAGSIITENEMVDHEKFSLDSNAANANVDSQMIRSQISAATHFPQHYLGDIGSANLATASSMELPVLKAVESRQEVFEQLFRWFIDRVIEEAIASQRLPEELSDEEVAERKKEGDDETTDASQNGKGDAQAVPSPGAAPAPGAGSGGEQMQQAASDNGKDDLPLNLGDVDDTDDAEGEEDIPDERRRDLGYDFGLPSPLRRMMTDLVNSVATIAKTFDPNGTNLELSRILLSVALGEGLEMQEPGEMVETIFPPGYKDPALAALQAAQNPAGAAPGAPGPNGGPMGRSGPPFQLLGADGNPYGAKQQGTSPDSPYGGVQEALWRPGGPVTRAEALEELEESHIKDRLSPRARHEMDRQSERAKRDFEDAAGSIRDLIR